LGPARWATSAAFPINPPPPFPPTPARSFEKLCKEGGAFTSSVTSGECAVACALHTLTGLQADVAEGLPKLAAFWAARKARTAKALAGLAPYYHPDNKEE
jgi:hypothetical protein